MIAAWMLYTLAVTTLLFAGASAAEYVARALRVPARFVWAVAILSALGLSARALTRRAEPKREAAVPSAASTRPLNRGSTISDAQRAYERWSRLRPEVRAQSSVTSATGAAPVLRRVARPLDLARLDVARLERWNTPLIALCVAASGLAFLWLIGSLVNLHRIERELTSELVDDDVVLVSNDVGPALFGIVRSRIVLPRWVLSLPEPERRIILAHEHQHASEFDPALLCAAAVALALQPWNVALWALFARLRFALETDCDGRVIEATGDARGYGRLLVTVYERTTPRLLPHVAFVERPSDLERRIRRMTRRPRLLTIAGATSALATLLLTTAAWTMSAPVRSRVSQTLIVQPPVWRLPTVMATGERAGPPAPAPKMGVITVLGVAPHTTIPSAQLTPSNDAPRPAVRERLARATPVGRERVCRVGPTDNSTKPLVMRASVDLRDATLNVDSLCMIDGEIVVRALDSSRVLVAWRDTVDAGIQNITYVIFTSVTPSVPSDLAWATTAGHAEFGGPRFFFASPAPGIPALVFTGPANAPRDQEAGALRFIIQRVYMRRDPSVPWDVLRQLPTASRCVEPLMIVDGVIVSDPRTAPQPDCFNVGGQMIRLGR